MVWQSVFIFTFNLTCETRCKGRQKNLEINYNLFFLLVSRVLVCVCTVLPLKPHLCSSSYIQSISPVFVLYKSLMHKAYQILDMPPPLSFLLPFFLFIAHSLPLLVSVANRRHMG